MKQFNIQIPSLLDNIRIVESFIDNAREAYSINDDIYGNIIVAVTESVNNAIKHGNQEDEAKSVDLTIEFDEHLVKFRIKDEGEGFDIDNLADPTAPENIEMPSGRGIFLMKNLSDEVNFSNNGSSVELVFYMN